MSVFPIVRLPVVSARGVQPFGGYGARCFIEIKGVIKIRDQQINTHNLDSWLSGKSLKLLPQMSHFKAKCIKFHSWCPSGCLFIRQSVTWSLTYIRMTPWLMDVEVSCDSRVTSTTTRLQSSRPFVDYSSSVLCHTMTALLSIHSILLGSILPAKHRFSKPTRVQGREWVSRV